MAQSILIVDDEKEIVSMLYCYFSKLGYTVYLSLIHIQMCIRDRDKEQTTEQAQPEAATPELPEETAPVQEKEAQPEQAAPAAPYYTINEAAAKRAKDANSFSDYKQGSATAEYRHYVDEAVQLAERQKQRVDPVSYTHLDVYKRQS